MRARRSATAHFSWLVAVRLCDRSTALAGPWPLPAGKGSLRKRKGPVQGPALWL